MINKNPGNKFKSERNILEVIDPTALQGKSDKVPQATSTG